MNICYDKVLFKKIMRGNSSGNGIIKAIFG